MHIVVDPAQSGENRVFRVAIVKALGPMAQLVARLVRNEKVRGSNPLRSTVNWRFELESWAHGVCDAQRHAGWAHGDCDAQRHAGE